MRHAHAVELAREEVPLVLQHQLGHIATALTTGRGDIAPCCMLVPTIQPSPPHMAGGNEPQKPA
jgi:hypothetical protein